MRHDIKLTSNRKKKNWNKYHFFTLTAVSVCSVIDVVLCVEQIRWEQFYLSPFFFRRGRRKEENENESQKENENDKQTNLVRKSASLCQSLNSFSIRIQLKVKSVLVFVCCLLFAHRQDNTKSSWTEFDSVFQWKKSVFRHWVTFLPSLIERFCQKWKWSSKISSRQSKTKKFSQQSKTKKTSLRCDTAGN